MKALKVSTTKTPAPMATIEYKGEYINNCMLEDDTEGFYINGYQTHIYKSLRAAKMGVTRRLNALMVAELAPAKPLDMPVVLAPLGKEQKELVKAANKGTKAPEPDNTNGLDDFEVCYCLELVDIKAAKIERKVKLGNDKYGKNVVLGVIDCTSSGLGMNIEVNIDTYYAASYYTESGNLAIYADSLPEHLKASASILVTLMQETYNIPPSKVSNI